ncbi:MAG TPA: homoserine dehydrogenase [Phycisphaerales bacterium]|nr:homoserine dehydrogenase [Phycisphaerales bacterium]
MRIVLIGFGSVGRALATLLESRRDELYARTGMSTKLVCVMDSRGAAVSHSGLDARALLAAKEASGTVGAVEGGVLGHDELGLLRDVQADVVVESSPSDLARPRPAIERMKAAMGSGKHVVTVNKAPLAVAMPALVELARFNRVELRYSGTVGAGTPVLATARTLGAGDTILKIRGIMNGTTNFILWKMAAEGETYAAALAEATRLGYAETDPSADVDGIDTATKVVILANAILRMGATVKDVTISGIRDFPKARINEAAGRGETMKLIGEIDAEARTLSVSPQAVAMHGPMDVPRALNAVQFTLARAGEVTLVGRGAGGNETATAILRDLVDVWHASGGA